MKALTDRQKVLLYKKCLKYRLFWRGYSPKFTIGNQVKIINYTFPKIQYTKSDYDKYWHYESGMSWSWLDDCRLKKLGQTGIIVEVDILKVSTKPIQVSPYTYFIRFKDGKVIRFCEENLTKVR